MNGMRTNGEVVSDGRSVPRATVSACIIACNEAERLPACLASVAFCDEIVVVDSGSTDGTVQLAEAAGARVVDQPWLGFAAQRNVALDHAREDWVLEVDADEIVTPRLREELLEFLADPPAGFDLGGLPLRDIFLGRTLRSSAKYPKYRHRFLRRGAYRHDEARTVHEGLVPNGSVHPFEGDLLHLLAANWHEALGDAWRYARLEAGQLHVPRTLKAFAIGAFVRPAVKLAYRLIVDGGWRDGWQGIAKISLDCTGDSIVWMRYMTGRRGCERGDSGVANSRHYGARDFRRGPVRVVGVAAGRRASDQALEWLTSARAAGIDVTLVSDADTNGTDLRVHRIPSLRPLTLIRSLDAEEQLRAIDVVLPFGRRARTLLPAVPPALRGIVPDVTEHDEPTAVAQRAARSRESTPV
jgi:glycosyltransferase involved in cell wall biosynthesis